MSEKFAAPSAGADLYAVIGNPIAHSKSPIIHEAFARQTGQNISYERILAPLDGFETTIQALIKLGYKGVNVTVPFKFEAYKLANAHSQRAVDAGAANTLTFNEHGIVADNTDGAGIVSDIEQNLQVSIESKRVLLLGAGGAAEGVLHPVLACGPALLVIANRTPDKAVAMVNKVALVETLSTDLLGCAFSDLHGKAFDIVINATSAGLSDAALPIPDSVFAKGCLAYDMMYGRDTPFMKQAREAGASVADGLGMLVEQAAEAFHLWRGIRPETRPVMKMVRAL